MICLFTSRDIVYLGKSIMGIFPVYLKGYRILSCLLPGIWDTGTPPYTSLICEQAQFHAQLTWACKKFYNDKARSQAHLITLPKEENEINWT